MLNKFFSHPLGHVLMILSLGILAYANSFGVPFVFDDETTILRNLVIQDLNNFLPGGSGYEYIPRRLFGYFTFALNYHFNGTEVAGYHLVNLAIHLCTALLLYALVRLTFRTPFLADSSMVQQLGTAALLAALLFAVHPVQTQAVTYIVQRLTSLATLLYLLSLVCYVQARLRMESMVSLSADPAHGKVSPPVVNRSKWSVAFLLGGSFLAAILAMKTKEIAFTLPLMAVLYEASFFRGEWRRRILVLLPLLLTLAIIPYSVFVAGDGVSLENDSADLEQQLRAHTDLPRLHYLFTQFRVIVTYLRLLFLPVGQNLDYDYPVFTTFFAAPVLLSFFLLTMLFLLTIFLYRCSAKEDHQSSRSRHELRIVAFGMLWFFLALSVESSLIPIADVISEHRLYLPSIGLAITAAILILLAAQTSATLLNGRVPLLVAALIILGLTTATWQRNQVWKSQLSLWQDVVRKSPDKGRPWYNLGTYLMGVGKLDEAIRSLSQSIKKDPDDAKTWHNIGLAHLMAGRYQEALYPLRQAVKRDPKNENATINLSIALIYTNQAVEAVARLEPIRQGSPNRPDVRYNLGTAYIRIGQLGSAKLELTALKRIDPGLASALEQQINQTSTSFSLE